MRFEPTTPWSKASHSNVAPRPRCHEYQEAGAVRHHRHRRRRRRRHSATAA